MKIRNIFRNKGKGGSVTKKNEKNFVYVFCIS